MTGRDDPNINVTDRMRHYCSTRPQQLDFISGYVFKSKSPSCGLHSIPVFLHGKIIDTDHRGLFAEAITSRYPGLPVSDELALATEEQRQQFIEQVLHYKQTQQQNGLK
ncbi:MAG: DUF523 domain-containing protein [Gammaproteobacteria bacterium]|nr:MAG: DUF523 domain-containing protein [Gammaproteobacteria bacterium]